LSNKLIVIKLINLIERDQLFKYKLSNKIVAIELINLIEKAKITNLEFLCLFKNFEIVNKFSKVNKTIKLIYLLNRIFDNLRS